MAQSSSSEIPQEVIDGVIDLCSKDRGALKTCSLISRAWSHRARKHLFSTLMLTSNNLQGWCWIMMTPMPYKGPRKQQSPTSCPPSPYAPLPSHVTSLILAASCSQAFSGEFEAGLHLASIHFSAFIHLSSLYLSGVSISFIAFSGAPLEATFGSFGKTVRNLRLEVCSLDWKVLAFLKLFTNLEELEIEKNIWVDYKFVRWTGFPENDTVLRGSFTASGFEDENIRLLDSLSSAKIEYHTITLGYNSSSTFRQFNNLFAKCKDHLETLVLREAGSAVAVDGQAFNLTRCETLVEIRARSHSAEFEFIIATLRTVSSRRFRKLTLLTTSQVTKIKLEAWAKLEEEISALVKRVGATAGNDTLEVVICSSSKTLGDRLSEVLPLISQDACVSLRTEGLPPPSNR